MINYKINLDSNNHLYWVEMSFQPIKTSHEFKLPTWIPGSYMIREFSRNIVAISATCGKQGVPIVQVNKNTWKVSKLKLNQDLIISYQVYAFDYGIRAAYLDNLRGYFNSSSVCLYVLGLESVQHKIRLANLSKRWEIATALPAISKQEFVAKDYDELIDCPVEVGKLTRLKFKVKGAEHHVVLSGIIAKNFDKAKLISDITKICNTQIDLFGSKAPFKSYTFLLYLGGEIYTGLEHRNSTALMAPIRSLPIKGATENSAEYIKLLSLISHEYFHNWNVKRIKPAVFSPYDLEHENYTKLLWWFEGVTSYYDDLILYKAGLIDQTSYLKIILNNINGVYKFKGAMMQSVANSSLTSWIKYYRQDENSPNSVVSYYNKGAIIGLCLDLYIRKKTAGVSSLDDVLLKLYKKWHKDGLGIKEDELIGLISNYSGCKLNDLLNTWVNDVQMLPFINLLAGFGIKVIVADQTYVDNGQITDNIKLLPKKSLIPDLGCSLIKDDLGYKVKHVYAGTAGIKAGIAAHDHLLALDGEKITDITSQLSRYKVGDSVLITLFRRETLLHLKLKFIKPTCSIFSIVVENTQQLKHWL